MMNMLIFVVTTLGLGVLCSIPGVLIGKYLTKNGLATDRTILEVTSNVFGLFLTRLILPDIPLAYVVTLFLLLSPLGVFGFDLWTTFRNGRWWWMKESSERQPLFSLPVSIIVYAVIGGVPLILAVGVWLLIFY